MAEAIQPVVRKARQPREASFFYTRKDRRICDGLTPKVAEAFGHQRSGTEEIERLLRDALAEKDWERAKRLSDQLAKPDSLAREASSGPGATPETWLADHMWQKARPALGQVTI